MAKIYSEGSQKSQGGDWDWVERSVLRKDLAAVAFSLKPGQVSDVIDTPESVYPVLVEQTRPAHVKPIKMKSRMKLKKTSYTRTIPSRKAVDWQASRKSTLSATSTKLHARRSPYEKLDWNFTWRALPKRQP